MRNTALSFVTPFPSNSSEDDCCSVTSTVDTTLPKEYLERSSSTINTRQRERRVHFDLAQNQSYDSIRQEDSRALWYSPTQLKQFRATFKSQAKAFRIIESEHDNSNDDNEHDSYARVLERVYETCCLYSTEVTHPSVAQLDAQQMRAWVKVTDSRWGLERLCVRAIAQDKLARRQDLYDTIDVMQQQHSSPESLAQACQNISRGPRYFAALLGQAQADAQSSTANDL